MSKFVSMLVGWCPIRLAFLFNFDIFEGVFLKICTVLLKKRGDSQ